MNIQQILAASEIKNDYLVKEFSDSLTFVTMFSNLISYCAFSVNYAFTDHKELNPTAIAIVCAEGNFVYFDGDLWEKLNTKQRAFLIVHEIMHIFLAHPLRRIESGYFKPIWDHAADYYVNAYGAGYYKNKDGEIRRESRAMQYLEIIPEITVDHLEHPIKLLLDEKYTGWTTDEIYRDLMEEFKDEIEEMQTAMGDPEDGLSSVGGKSTLDGHTSADGSDDGIGEQIQKNQITLLSAVESAKADKNIGQHDLGLIRVIDALVAPVIDWKDHMKDVVKSCVPLRSTYNRISRRRSGGIVFPTYDGEHLDVVWGIDSSGSMTEEDIIKAYSEMVGILEELDTFTIKVVTCDTKAHLIAEYDQDSYQSPADLDLRVVGGGGTILNPIVEYADALVEDGDNVDLLVVVSDGFIFEGDLTVEGETEYDRVFVTTRADQFKKGWTNIRLTI